MKIQARIQRLKQELTKNFENQSNQVTRIVLRLFNDKD